MTETPQYSILKRDKEFELRRYAGYIQAHVDVTSSNYRTAVEQGFNILAGYIFGNNESRQSIEMTTPVKVAQSEKIAMTTPVTVSGDGSFTVAFIMPATYQLDTLPIPKDGRIQFTQFPTHLVAAACFSGYFIQKTIQKYQSRLSQWITAQGLETEGDFTVAGYNPPWVPGFLAKNEVLIRIHPGTTNR
jgi:hypothetical protein